MKIYEIITERSGQQKVVTMYHGTSSVFLPSIRKFGLDPNPKPIRKPGDPHPSQIRKLGLDPIPAQKSWYPDGKEALLSYGGVYITTSNDVATTAAQAAAKRHGGEPILITVQYVLGSGGLDEDQANDTILKSFFLSSNSVDFAKKLANELLSKYKIVYPIGSYQDFINLYKLMMKRYLMWIKADPDPNGIFKRTDSTFWTASELAYNMMSEDLYVYLAHEPYRNLVKKIIEKTKVSKPELTYSKPDSEGNIYIDKFTNVRVTRPITFRGKTRIVDISKIQKQNENNIKRL